MLFSQKCQIDDGFPIHFQHCISMDIEIDLFESKQFF